MALHSHWAKTISLSLYYLWCVILPLSLATTEFHGFHRIPSSQKLASRTHGKPSCSLWLHLSGVTFFYPTPCPKSSRYFLWSSELQTLPPQLSEILTHFCLHNSCSILHNLPPERKPDKCGTQNAYVPSLKKNSFALPVIQCMKAFVSFYCVQFYIL